MQEVIRRWLRRCHNAATLGEGHDDTLYKVVIE